ncbi:MAG: histidine kinase dimerization/phospho-acceptor domain-containing protein, partial [Nitriliruptorales bacterium]|nr:histidine kinase dimerization/phospho-acceptor domain-containing protein [Nitriliruptorales bacterium]
MQFGLFTLEDGGRLPFPRWPVAILYAVVLLATNLLSLWATRHASPETLRRIGLLELFIDTTLVNGIVILFGFDEDSRMWPLLSFPIVEGAMRAQLRGAMLTWAYGAAVYVTDQLIRLPGRENPAAWIGSIPWGAGILLFIGLGTGLLAKRVHEATIAQAQDVLRLRRLAERSRQINAPRRLEDVFGEVAAAARELTGLSRVALYERLDDGTWCRRAQSGTRGIVGADPEHIPAFDTLVRELDGPAEVELTGAMAERTRNLVPDATRVWAAPLEHEQRLTGLLLIAQGSDEQAPDEAVVPLLGLLASLGSVAVDNARLSEAEERTIDELRELDQLKDDFFSILAHELRSPIASVSGAAELLTVRFDELAPGRREQLLRLVRDGSHRLNSLIEDVYDAMRAERMDLPINSMP